MHRLRPSRGFALRSQA